MMTMVISGSDGVTFPDSTNQFSGGAFSFKNRILNGDMRIDQRNAGASVATPSNGQFALDRFRTFTSGGGVYSVGQSSTAPTGFTNSMLFTVTTADLSIAAADFYLFTQTIEGNNVADLGFGTASAKTVTVSFWVRSSVTGTFAFSLRQGSGDRSYVAEYTVSSADTWEQKTITIAGDTSGTWSTDTGPGMICTWDLGSGSDRNATANTWSAGNYFRTSSCVDLIATNGATLYITGVQLEVGSVATPFERRPFTTELQLCQRYYCKTFDFATAPANNGGNNGMLMCGTISSGNYEPNAMWRFPVEMRADPTVTLYNPSTGTTGQWQGGGVTSSNARVGSGGSGGIVIDNTDTNLTGSNSWRIQAAASAEL
jgi:hypothetical protein